MFEDLENNEQELDALQETLEILQDAELMQAIHQSLLAIENGETVSLEEAKRLLGLG